MQFFPGSLLILAGLIVIARPITIMFHELGHAIPAILLTKQKVTIYVGSHGDPKHSLKINSRLLTIVFRYNPFTWNLGLCIPSAKAISINNKIVYTLAGPLISLLIGSIACYFMFAYDLQGVLRVFLIAFICFAFFDFLGNLIPIQKPITLYDGTIIYNDGYSLKQLFYYRRLPKDYSEAVDLYNEKKFAEAAMLLEKLFYEGLKDENIYRLLISSYTGAKNYHKAKEFSDAFALTGKMNSDDFSNMALSYSQLGQHDEALEFYNKSIELNQNHKYSLNNKGYTLNLLNRFEDAIPLFDRAIEIGIDSAYAYNNRGLSKIKLGRVKEGLDDINRSLKLDSNNSYAYRNLGIYHLDKGELDEALGLFVKAKELDDTTHMIDELINDAKHKIDRQAAGNKS